MTPEKQIPFRVCKTFAYPGNDRFAIDAFSVVLVRPSHRRKAVFLRELREPGDRALEINHAFMVDHLHDVVGSFIELDGAPVTFSAETSSQFVDRFYEEDLEVDADAGKQRFGVWLAQQLLSEEGWGDAFSRSAERKKAGKKPA